MKIDIYISNISEDVWDFIETLKKKERKFEIEENAYLSDRELLTLNPLASSIIIFPENIDPSFIEYYKHLFKNNTVDVMVPEQHSGQICKDIIQDAKLWQKLVALGSKNTLVLKSYSSSPQFYELAAALQDAGCDVTFPESPLPELKDIVNHFGSKSGVRKTVSEITSGKKIKWIAEGAVASTTQEAIKLATKFYNKCGGVVIKTNKAHSGAGVIIIPPGTIVGDVAQHFSILFAHEAYWAKFPIVVEEFLTVDASVGGGNPNCEYKVDETGKLQLLYVCGMRITPEGVFKGVEINNNLFDHQIKSKLQEYGQALGSMYSSSGYRGYFDVDCMYTKDKDLLITESNVRKTGGTHVYHTGNILLGRHFCDEYYLLSNNTHPLPAGKNFTFSELLNTLEPILFSHTTHEGVILASSNILKQHKLSHIIVGKNKIAAYSLENEMERLLAA